MWFLPIILGPLAIHLLSKRNAKKMEFSSLKFLKMIEDDALKRINLKQIILLILRILMLLILILAFAQPVFHGNADVLDTSSGRLSIVLMDNTASMLGYFNSKIFENDVQELKNLQRSGGNLIFCSLGDTMITNEISDIKPTFFSQSIQSWMSFIGRKMDVSKYPSKELIIISDGDIYFDDFAEVIKSWDVKYISRNSNYAADMGIESVELPNQILNPGQILDIRFPVSSNSNSISNSDLLLNGNRVSSTALEIKENETAIGRMSTEIKTSGIIEGIVRLNEDDNYVNNQLYFSLNARPEIRVTVAAKAIDINYWTLISQALKTSGSNIKLNIQLISEPLDLSVTDVLIISGNSDEIPVSDNTWKQYANQGGSFIILGPLHKSFAYLFNRKAMDEKTETRVNYPISAVSSGYYELLIKPFAIAIMNERVLIKERYTGYNSGTNTQEVIAQYSDGFPFITMMSSQKTKAIWVNADVSIDKSNLLRSGYFLPQIQNWVHQILPQGQMRRLNQWVGDSLDFHPINYANSDDGFQVRLPKEQIVYAVLNDAGNVSIVRTETPGFYQLFRGNQHLETIAVNCKPSELTANINENPDLEAYLLDAQYPLKDQVIMSRNNQLLWPILFILLGILWLAETIIARGNGKKLDA